MSRSDLSSQKLITNLVPSEKNKMFDYSIANRSLVFFILFIAAADTKSSRAKNVDDDRIGT